MHSIAAECLVMHSRLANGDAVGAQVVDGIVGVGAGADPRALAGISADVPQYQGAAAGVDERAPGTEYLDSATLGKGKRAPL
jgi:hypothetical protein